MALSQGKGKLAKLAGVVFCAMVAGMSSAADVNSSEASMSDANANPLVDMSLEDLLSVRVTSASRKNQRLADTASAVFVINQEDIRRSGVTSIPEALRMVPGLEVARIGNNKWAITSRGFNGRYANKLLVLVDGRSVYTPLFSGVWWEAIDTLMEDVDRIEVIRGPGAALWGANAVNGVINIITRNARDAQGGQVSALAGDHERGSLSMRYGGQTEAGTYYRVYGKSFDRGPTHDALHDSTTQDGWHSRRAGFRADHFAGEDQVSLQGETYRSQAGDTTAFSPDFLVRQTNAGAHLLGRWDRKLSDTSSFTLQSYLDHTRLVLFGFEETRDVFDVDAQHRFSPTSGQDVIWGLNYRVARTQAQNGSTIVLTPERSTQSLFSLFVQDDITLEPERWRLTLGTKLEHNSYTGLELQPNARLLWTPDATNTWWFAASRGVRTPSRLDTDGAITVFSSSAAAGVLQGTQNFKSEVLTAFELGYRSQLTPALSMDMATFYNRYSNLRGIKPIGAAVGPINGLTYYPYTVVSLGEANVAGAELSLDWRALSWWRLRGAYTWLRNLSYSDGVDLVSEPATHELLAPTPESTNPKAQWSLRSSMDLARIWELDLTLRHVGGLASQGIPAYTTFDARVGWKPSRDLEISLVGQNLSQGRHTEFRSDWAPSTLTDVPRSVYLKALLKF